MLTADSALQRLKEGNRRFLSGQSSIQSATFPDRRRELTSGQSPFAIVLGCSDSRVPAELVFDQGIGDLFVIRVAGNIVAPSQLASIEFAVEQFGTELLIVLGHSRCGAIRATLDYLSLPAGTRPANPGPIVDHIRPNIQGLLDSSLRDDPEKLLSQSVRSNILACVDELREGSEVLKRQIEQNRLKVAGAEYALETGEVEFINGTT